MIQVLEAFKDKLSEEEFTSLRSSISLRDENFTQVHINNQLLRDKNESLQTENNELKYELEKSAVEIALLRQQIENYKKAGLEIAGQDSLADLEKSILLELVSSSNNTLDIDRLSENLNHSPGEIELHLAYLNNKHLINHDSSNPGVSLTDSGIKMVATFSNHQLN